VANRPSSTVPPDAAPPEAPAARAADPALPSVGARIRTYRQERGWTQDQLAAATGVSRSAVAQWETDRAGQLRDNISRIAAALGINVEVLLHGPASREAARADSGDELALLRLYRECDPEDRAFLLRTARKLAKG
jgi:transcriptional regulator with XRE-family HTH domain